MNALNFLYNKRQFRCCEITFARRHANSRYSTQIGILCSNYWSKQIVGWQSPNLQSPNCNMMNLVGFYGAQLCLIPWENFLAYFVAYCESFMQDIKTIVLEIRVLCCFWERKLDCHHILYFSLKIVKSLQRRGRRQIAKPRKYCLMCDYFSLMYFFFFLICISLIWEFHTYSHQNLYLWKFEWIHEPIKTNELLEKQLLKLC